MRPTACRSALFSFIIISGTGDCVKIGVFAIQRYQQQLYDLTHQGDRFRDVEIASANLINVVTGSELQLEARGGRIDMCKAIDEMRQESRNEARREDRQEGFLEALAGLVQKGLLPLADAAKEAGLSPDEFQTKTSGMR